LGRLAPSKLKERSRKLKEKPKGLQIIKIKNGKIP
jgi:hypothetical protein